MGEAILLIHAGNVRCMFSGVKLERRLKKARKCRNNRTLAGHQMWIPDDRHLYKLLTDLGGFFGGIFALVAGWFAYRAGQNQAKATLQASRDQIAIAKRGLIDTERAYIFCDHIDATWAANKKTEQVTKWIFTIIWRNSGRTPTRYGRCAVNIWDGANGAVFPADFDYPDYTEPGPIIIAPSAIMHSVGFEINVDRLEEIRQGFRAVYIWGWCDYNDVFDDTDQHRSEFCFEVTVSGNPIYKEGGFKYRRHGPFNGFDRECFRAPTPIRSR
jgi:hypothetical protein